MRFDATSHLVQERLHHRKPLLTIEIQGLRLVVVTELHGEKGELGELKIGRDLNTLVTQGLQKIGNVMREWSLRSQLRIQALKAFSIACCIWNPQLASSASSTDSRRAALRSRLATRSMARASERAIQHLPFTMGLGDHVAEPVASLLHLATGIQKQI